MAVKVPRNWASRFFTIWIGQAFSLFGSNLVQFALVWWLTATTQSATILATSTLVAMLPQVLLGPVAGALVDRWNRRIVMIAADSITALTTLGLVILFASGAAQVWHVYVALLVRSLMGAFQFPAMQATTTLMVPQKHYSRIAGANQALGGLMNIIAPPVGAVLLMTLPLQSVLLIDVFTALLGVSPLLFIAVPQPPRRASAAPDAPKPSVWQDMREGLRYVRTWPGMMVLIGMALSLNFLLTPAFSLLPLLVTNHFGGQADALAALNSASGIGIVVGGLLLSIWGGFKRRIVTSLCGLIGIGLGTLLIGLAPATAFALALISMIVVSLMQPFTNGPIFAILQVTVAPELQGRVMSLIGSLTTAVTPLGLLLAGPIADAIGVRGWYVVAGLVCVVEGIVAFFIPTLLYIENGRPEDRKDSQTEVEPAATAPTA